MAIGELNIQTCIGLYLGGTAQHAPLRIAYQGEATGEHILIRERGEQLGLIVEASARCCDHVEARTPARALKSRKTVAAQARDANDEMRP